MTHAFITSPDIVTAMAFAGTLSFNLDALFNIDPQFVNRK
jgi:aconitase A